MCSQEDHTVYSATLRSLLVEMIMPHNQYTDQMIQGGMLT